MSIDLSILDRVQRLLFAIPLKPVQGSRFQPTGFPGLGAATFKTPEGDSLLVESAQSMANRLEMTIWDDAAQDLKSDVQGVSHVRVLRHGKFLTDTVLESHRLNSPYLLESDDKSFLNRLALKLGFCVEVEISEKVGNKKTSNKTVFTEYPELMGFLEKERSREPKTSIQEMMGLIDRKMLTKALLSLDVGSLLHGVFLAKKDLAGGRMRVPRALSAFIEATGVRIAASGGVKNDHIHPSKVEGDSKNLFGNIPFARDEFTADDLTLYVNLDLAQIRGYGLGADVERLLILLALYKLRALLEGNLRLRSACDLEVKGDIPAATKPAGFLLPTLADIQQALAPAIAACQGLMTVTEAVFNDELKKSKDDENKAEQPEPGEE